MTEGKEICETSEVDVRLGWGGRGRDEMVQEGRVDAIRGVHVWEAGEAGLLSPAREFFGFPYR